MGFLLQPYFPEVNIMILDAISGAFIGLLYWLIFGKGLSRGGSVAESYNPDRFQEIENSICWTKVGPEEMELISKLRNAQGIQAKVIMRELTKREALVIPEDYTPSAAERADDMRYWIGLALTTVIVICTFQLSWAFAFTHLQIDVWANQPNLIWGRLFLTLMINVVVCWLVLKLVNTTSWQRLIVTGIGFVVALIIVVIVYMTTTFDAHMKAIEKLATTISKMG